MFDEMNGFVCRSIDHDSHTFVVHYDTYNSDATLSLDGILPLGKHVKQVLIFNQFINNKIKRQWNCSFHIRGRKTLWTGNLPAR